MSILKHLLALRSQKPLALISNECHNCTGSFYIPPISLITAGILFGSIVISKAQKNK